MPPPPAIDHPALGRLTYRPDLVGYEGALPGLEAPLRIEADEGGAEARALRVAERIGRGAARVVEAAAAYAVAELLELKNDVWLGEDEDPVSEGAFRARLRLEGVVAYPDGAEVAFEDGDLFWGHTVLVQLGPDGAPVDADIAG